MVASSNNFRQEERPVIRTLIYGAGKYKGRPCHVVVQGVPLDGTIAPAPTGTVAACSSSLREPDQADGLVVSVLPPLRPTSTPSAAVFAPSS